MRVNRIYLALLVVLTTTGVLTGVAGANGNGSVLYEGSFSARDLTWAADETGALIPVLANTRTLTEPQRSQLPRRELTLLVPYGLDIADLEIEVLASHQMKVPGRLSVSGPMYTDAGQMMDTPRLPLQGDRFPHFWGEFTGTHLWRGYQLATIIIYPVREVLGSQGTQVEILDDFAVRIVTGEGRTHVEPAQRLRLVPGETIDNESMLRRFVANPETISGYVRQNGQVVAEPAKGFAPTRTPSLSGSAVAFLIITSESLKSEFERLADYRTAQGIPTVVATREYIEANFRNGADVQETIRMFIKDAYEKWGIEYVLLGGDTDILPARYINNTFYPTTGSTDIPVDLYFACLDGNWNDDGDAIFAEPKIGDTEVDNADFAEEVYLGRAPVSDVAAAGTFIDKVIAYEGTLSDTGWTNRALFAAEVLFPDDYEPGDQIALDGAQFAHGTVTDLLEACTDMEYLRMYETNVGYPSELPLHKSALVDTLNTGHYGIFNQIGHGYYFNMSVGDDNFVNSDADGLTNGDHLFLLYSLNCASAAFDYSCLMERFLQNPNGGSVASIGAARAAFPVTSNSYQTEFFDQLFCQTDNRVGKLVALSRLPFLPYSGSNYLDRWTFENYTLLGDPLLCIWTATPKVVSIGGAGTLQVGPQTVNLTVTADLLPAEDALVCLSKDGEDLAYGYTNASGQISLDFLPTSTGNATLTVTGVNMEIKTMTLPVTSGTAYLALNSFFVVDSGVSGSSGNGNGMAEAGETIAVYSTLRETGGSSATGLSSVLSTTASGVNIIDDTVTYPNVTAGGTTTGQGTWRVSFDSSVADATPIEFTVTVTDDSGTSINQTTLVLKAPEIELVYLDWNDSDGDSDGLLDNNEPINLDLVIKNFGAGQCDELTIYLRTDSANVALGDTIVVRGPLSLMGEDNVLGLLQLSVINTSQAYGAHLVLEDNYGRTQRHDFDLARPVTPSDVETDPSLGADIIALTWLPSTTEGVLGYNVYRSESESGPFVKANTDLVTGVSYFRDEGLGLLTRYYYKIVSVDETLIPSEMTHVVTQSTAPAESDGFPLPFEIETSGHPAVADIDGDGDMEMVISSDEVYVWHHDGQELMDGDNNSQSLGPLTNLGSVLHPAGITLATIDSEPGFEIIVSEHEVAEQIRIIDKNGQDVAGWPKALTGVSGTRWNWATPAVGDIDGDGDHEIVVNTLNGRVWAWHHDGTEVRDGDSNAATDGLFYVRPGADWEWSLSGPALYDLDGDGARDVIFGTRYDNTGLRRLMAVRYDGTDVAGFPYQSSGPIICTPAVGDLNNDGVAEIIFFDVPGNLYAVQQDGTDYPGFPVYIGLGGLSDPGPSLALGDMDNDGELEIVWAINSSGSRCDLVVIDTDVSGGTSGDILDGWPVMLPGSSEASPVIGDIDGDGSPDIVFGIGGGSTESPDNLYAFHADGTGIDGFPITMSGPARTAPVICDLEGDGDVDIVYASWDRQMHVWDMPFAYDADLSYWPTYQSNILRTGVFLWPALVPVDEPEETPPARFLVKAPYPNPFNPSCTVRLYVAPDGTGSGDLELDVYDIQGRRVRTMYNGRIGGGWHSMVWDGRGDDGRSQASGLYFMRGSSGGVTTTHKMSLVK